MEDCESHRRTGGEPKKRISAQYQQRLAHMLRKAIQYAERPTRHLRRSQAEKRHTQHIHHDRLTPREIASYNACSSRIESTAALGPYQFAERANLREQPFRSIEVAADFELHLASVRQLLHLKK